MDFKNADILSTEQFDRASLEHLFEVALKMEPFAKKEKKGDLMNGKILASLFYEPSTRTRFSFETAMKRLGGETISATEIASSSIFKGETLADTAKVVEKFADVIAIRHPESGSAQVFADNASIPVLNAGDGPNQHPSQSLLDMYTIKKECGKIDGLTIAMVGDLKYGRTVHSLSLLLRHYDVKIVLVSPDELKMPKEYLEKFDEKGLAYEEILDLGEAAKKSDVIYMTRVQKERFTDLNEYEKLKNAFVMSRGLIEEANKKAIIMHPLPRIGEISLDMDDFAGSAYFRQVENGVAVRMAMISLVLGKA
ncbi:MAG: aspartate carbamoyltransferase [Candidatus Peregrinibacteria bacterium GW2011_GWC2_39_14]|nr:MAG: Aspartate carbamoyltransferase [Candidatus Peregrinibacteria bacterium GW2011_GWA2_38_36]KKR06819.1 MAG: aspartate carbamoyltransferase [Candidatus Peregrinibacteria bacterium GW2011_GWC2_39_14]